METAIRKISRQLSRPVSQRMLLCGAAGLPGDPAPTPTNGCGLFFYTERPDQIGAWSPLKIGGTHVHFLDAEVLLGRRARDRTGRLGRISQGPGPRSQSGGDLLQIARPDQMGPWGERGRHGRLGR